MIIAITELYPDTDKLDGAKQRHKT